MVRKVSKVSPVAQSEEQERRLTDLPVADLYKVCLVRPCRKLNQAGRPPGGFALRTNSKKGLKVNPVVLLLGFLRGGRLPYGMSAIDPKQTFPNVDIDSIAIPGPNVLVFVLLAENG